MTGKKLNKFKPDKLENIPTKETARAIYEKLQDDGTEKPIEQWENSVEIKIKKAMAQGEFDNLQGKGKPLDLSKYSEVPEHLRIAYHLLKNAGFVPEEVRLKKEMERIKEKIKLGESKQGRDRLRKELADISQQYHFYMEYNKQFNG